MSDIQIKNVVKEYSSTFTALRGVSIDVAEGEFVSLLGPSGCGKTTLLRSIAGLEDIHGGSISVKGKVLSEKGYTMPPERRNVGLIFQSYALWPHMTVFKNIAYGLKLHGWSKADIGPRVAEVLKVVGLEGLEERYPSQLSGGQMQRVAVARSLAAAPSVLLFDEPLSNLDAKLRESMRVELRRIQKEVGTTAVYVTHDQAEAMVISDRIVLMNQGEIVQQGTAKELYETPETMFAAKFLGFANMLAARVISTDAGSGLAQFELEGVSAPLITGRARKDVHVNDRVHLSLRPEAIRIGSTTDTSHGFPDRRATLPASVEDVIYAGNICDVFLNVSGLRLRAQVTPGDLEGLSVGDGVTAIFDSRSIWPVPADDATASVDAVGVRVDEDVPMAAVAG
ncbi:ABC transporter ATP-binding protein [Arthrobacter sp. NPDC093139]|uniref:ABC transporter ATP-binding protein n=1 Tax=Arthrobacter sp. NPDC093139 TaxID=3363945 RepID=UPI003801D1FE